MTGHQVKDKEAKQLPADNGGSKILCLPRSREFRYGSLRYASLLYYISSPFVFPVMYVVDVIFIFRIKLYTSCPLF